MSWRGIHGRLDRSKNVNVDGLVGRDLSQASNGTGSEQQGRCCCACHTLQVQQGTSAKMARCDAKKQLKLQSLADFFNHSDLLLLEYFSGILLVQAHRT